MKGSLLMLVALSLGATLGPAAAASRVAGWEEQSWRSGFLGAQERWQVGSQISLRDPAGHEILKGSLVIMRSGLMTHVDPAVDVAVFAPEGGPRSWFIKQGDRIEFFQDKEKQSGQSEQAWWSRLGASSGLEWISWIVATPLKPHQDDCRFDRPKEAGGTVLFSRCKWNGSTVLWKKWGEIKVAPEWSMWVPVQTEVHLADGSTLNIQTQAFDVRMHGEGEHNWPFTINGGRRHLEEPEVPLEDLDFHSW